LKDVVQAARRSRIDFVVITDHGTRGYAHEDMSGWHDGVLVLFGEEVSTPQGHLLAFETQTDVGEKDTFQDALDEIERQCGTAVSIHHQLPKIGEGDFPRTALLALGQAQLLEIWSFMDDFLSQQTPQSVGKKAAPLVRALAGPPRQLLREWDRHLALRPLPIVGGLNVHRRKHPLLEWREFFPYQTAMGTVSTVIQCPALPKQAKRACDLVWDALRNGRSYVANRLIGPEKGFQFEYHPPSGRARQMGETVEYTPGGRFSVRVPAEAEVVLRHNGQPLFWGTASQMTFPTASPGSYRVEINLSRKLWILSNPIRLVDEEGVLQPTVSDVT
jgi:hypothetical protein